MMDKLEEMKKKFHILDDWKITIDSGQRLNGTPYTGECDINLDRHTAVIYPWHTDELEPSDYILHEILHIALQAALVNRECKELFVQDLCIQFKEIKQLEKEKEWLISELTGYWTEDVEKVMQQALKVEGDENNKTDAGMG